MHLKVKLTALAAAAIAMLCFGVSLASATITPSSGSITGTNSGSVTLKDTTWGINDTCTTVDMYGSITIDNPSGQGGGGSITSWNVPSSGCGSAVTGGPTSSNPWTLDATSEVGGLWDGTVKIPSASPVTIDGCSFSGTLDGTYSNSTGKLTLSSGTLSGSGLCGNGTVTGTWVLTDSSGGYPQLS